MKNSHSYTGVDCFCIHFFYYYYLINVLPTVSRRISQTRAWRSDQEIGLGPLEIYAGEREAESNEGKVLNPHTHK